MDFESINILSVGINAIATVALVIATIILANFNKKLWLAQDKPWLAFYVKNLDFGFIDGPLPIVLYAKNFGKGPALNIKFKVDLINERLHREYESLSSNEEKQVMEIPESAIAPPFLEFYINEITYKDINGIPLKQSKVPIRAYRVIKKAEHQL